MRRSWRRIRPTARQSYDGADQRSERVPRHWRAEHTGDVMTKEELEAAAEREGFTVEYDEDGGGVFLTTQRDGLVRQVRVRTTADPVGLPIEAAIAYLRESH